MASLIEQLQQQALDPSAAIADLLRKTKLVAVKLDRVETATWVAHELNGYPRDGEVPEYRKVVGEPRWLNPVRGWCPLIVEDDDVRRAMSKQPVYQPVSELQSMLAISNGSQVYISYHPKLVRDIEERIGFDIGGAALWFGKSAVAHILDAVRTRILDWAVELERAGVRGEGTLSFSKHDRDAASHVTYNITVGGSVTGAVGGVSGHATVNAMHIGPEMARTLAQLADEIERSAGQVAVPARDREELKRHAMELKQEVRHPTPDTTRLASALGSIKSIAELAVGDLIATGILAVLARPEIAALLQHVVKT